MLARINEIREQVTGSWRRLDEFLKYDLWHQLPPLFTRKGLTYRLLRLYYILAKGFREDDLRLHAISLTYNTLIALIPLLALSLAILKGFGYGTELEEFLLSYFQDYPPEFQDFMNQILTEVKKANFAQLGGIGGIMLLMVLLQVLIRTEATFNAIWNIRKSRGFLRNASNYISVMIVVPFLFILALTLKAQLQFGEEMISRVTFLVPFMVTWLALTFLYLLMPNTRVKTWAAAVSGLLAASLWNLLLNAYMAGQPAVTKYNVIYGSLALLPIFLIWLFLSWFIVLLGAKITFAVQYSNTFQPARTGQHAGARSRLLVALAVLTHCARAFAGNGERFHDESFGRDNAVPTPLLNRVLDLLRNGGLIAEAGDEGCWLLARDPHAIPLHAILDLVMEEGESPERLGLAIVASEPEATLAAYQERWQGQEGVLADLIAGEDG